MVGAVVLIALAVIFIPMLLDGTPDGGRRSVKLDIPPKPDQEYHSRVLPLEEPGASETTNEGSGQGLVKRNGGAARTARAEQSGGGATEAGASPPQGAAGEGRAEQEPAAAPEETALAGESGGSPSETRAPAAGGLANWFVQVGSFSREDNAVELRDRLRNAGYSAFTETSTVEGSTIHRVKVGPEMDKARAEKLRDGIAQKMDLKGIVVSEP